MNSFTSVILLGLLALGHTISLTTVTQIPQTDNDLVLEEGFLPSLTTQSSVVRATNSALVEGVESIQPEGNAMDEEGSAMGGDQNNTRVQRHSDILTTVAPLQSSTTTISFPEVTMAHLPGNMNQEGSGEGDQESHTTTTTTTSAFTSSSNEGMLTDSEGSGTTEELLTTTITPVTTTSINTEGSGTLPDSEGSGTTEEALTTTITPVTTTSTNTEGPGILPDSEGSGTTEEPLTTTITPVTTTSTNTEGPGILPDIEGSGRTEEPLTTTITPVTTTSTNTEGPGILPKSEGSGKTEELLTTTITPETTTSTITEGLGILPYVQGSGKTEELLTTTTATITTTTILEPVIVLGRGIHLGAVPGNVEPAATELTTAMPVDHETPELSTNALTSMTMIGAQPLENVTEMKKGHVTPDWVIILGFLVGVAALVLLCVAIATRDRWNRPNQFNTTIVTPQPADLHNAVEMETFLQNEQPRENGKSEEYTVIPLDELPQSYSS